MSILNNPEAVRQHYATDDSQRVRQEIHMTYTIPRIDYIDWLVGTMHWRGNETLLDVGCGTGKYYEPLKSVAPGMTYYGLDFSAGMLKNHPALETVQLADARMIPYADNSFDVVMANHMIYHLPDIDAGIHEFRRVLKPDGVLVVGTNSNQTMPELQVLMRRAILLLTRTGGSQVQPPIPASDLFSLENGTRTLSHHFYAVVRHDLPTKLVFPDIEPIMDYLESTRNLREPQLPQDVNWDDVMMIMRQQITHLVNHLGEMTINKLTGVIFASDRGGFIGEFKQHHSKALAAEQG